MPKLTPIPAACDHCGHFFIPKLFSMANVTSFHIENVTTNCERCQRDAKLFEGIVSVENHGQITVLAASPDNAAMMDRVQEILGRAATGAMSPTNVIAQIEPLAPQLAEILKQTAHKRPRLFVTVCAAIMLILSKCTTTVNVEVSIDANELFDQLVELSRSDNP